jgi:membrane protein
LLPGLPALVKVVDFAISFGVITLLFAMMYRYLPDARIEWSDVWAGAALTAALFVIGQFLLGWYLGRASVASAYGAFGSLVVFLLWTNYSAQIFLFGAEFTHAFARRHGSHSAAASTVRGTTDSPLSARAG